tara:strand:+ start:171 stop:326 length:156 start_codon:yes stop_codon:yes gene_type:complete
VVQVVVLIILNVVAMVVHQVSVTTVHLVVDRVPTVDNNMMDLLVVTPLRVL